MPRDIERAAIAVRLRLIRYCGRIVAAAAAERVYLAPAVVGLAGSDPLLRFVAAMCLYAHDVETGTLPGGYDDAAAELYARCILIADNDFRRRQHEPDDRLAESFRVPLEQVAAKRRDLADGRDAGGRSATRGTYPRRRPARR